MNILDTSLNIRTVPRCNICNGIGLVKCETIMCDNCNGNPNGCYKPWCIAGYKQRPWKECDNCYGCGEIHKYLNKNN